MTVDEAVRTAAARLAAVSGSPRLDAELLMAHALGTDRSSMLLSGPSQPVPAEFEPLLTRRLAGEPIAYITGWRDFWTIELEVGPGVLVPRPDSETLLEAAVAHFRGRAPSTILDLGTGPGSLLLAALAQWPDAVGIGVDSSEAALVYARRNAERLGLTARAELRLGDWCEGLSKVFDLVLCNPPYVEAAADLPRDVRDWEPAEALFAGEDGLEDYRRLAPQIARLLAPEGIACIEVGAGQAPAVTALFEAHGLTATRHKDLAGHVRCLALAA